MNVSVIIPYSPHPSRHKGKELVKSLYREAFPDWQCIVWNDGRYPYNKAQANNDAVASLGYDPNGIIIFNDADSLCMPTAIKRAAHIAFTDKVICRPFKWYRRLSPLHSELVDDWMQAWSHPAAWEMPDSMSHGCIAIPMSVYREAMGYDPRFEGWGYEDLAADIMWGAFAKAVRVDSTLVHLHHEPIEGREDQKKFLARNENLYYNRYCRLQGDREGLLKLRKEAEYV